MYQKKVKRGNYRSVSNLCPNCFSTLNQDITGALSCSGDRMKAWQEEITKFKALTEDDKDNYLTKFDNPSKFLELVNSINGQDCGFSTKISHVVPSQTVRIPDPVAVKRLERTLQRVLMEEELYEEHTFLVDNKPYKLPYVNFPDDV